MRRRWPGRRPDHPGLTRRRASGLDAGAALEGPAERQLIGVLAHELSHVANRDILISSVAASIAMGITLIASLLRFTAIFRGGRNNDENPIALQVLGVCSALAVTKSLSAALLMCAALTGVLVGSNVVLTLLRHA